MRRIAVWVLPLVLLMGSASDPSVAQDAGDTPPPPVAARDFVVDPPPRNHRLLGALDDARRLQVLSPEGAMRPWSFGPNGGVRVAGPEGTGLGRWRARVTAQGKRHARDFDAVVDFADTSLRMWALGSVSQDGNSVALTLVIGPGPGAPSAASSIELPFPGPRAARLMLAQRLGGGFEAFDERTECLRPSWLEDGTLDPDKCDLDLTTFCRLSGEVLMTKEGEAVLMGTVVPAPQRMRATLDAERYRERPPDGADWFVDRTADGTAWYELGIIADRNDVLLADDACAILPS
jgi:hypothetical protein